jgi:hypothetical protein
MDRPKAKWHQGMDRNVIVGADESVSCPKCDHRFPLGQGISRQTIDRYAQDFEHTVAAEARLRAQKESAQEIAAVNARLAAAEAALKERDARIEKVREEATRAARETQETELKALQEANNAREEALAKARRDELDLRRRLREAEDARKSADVEHQRKLDDERKRIAAQERATVSEEFERRLAQKDTQIQQAQKEAADLKRKLEQGSQQVQGEALELGLEAMLHEAFPLDAIEAVPKGITGADLLQRVRSPSGHDCGTIVWETKQTKGWNPSWLQKLKDDQRAIGAEIAVIVTAAMPRECAAPFLRQDDVWIASVAAARPLAEALRATLHEMHKLRQANSGRSEKMELLYNYLCSPQFAQRMKAVVDGAAAMRRELDEEKRAFTRLWQRREKQIDRVADCMVAIIGDLQGIGNGALPQLDSIAALPLMEVVDGLPGAGA